MLIIFKLFKKLNPTALAIHAIYPRSNVIFRVQNGTQTKTKSTFRSWSITFTHTTRSSSKKLSKLRISSLEINSTKTAVTHTPTTVGRCCENNITTRQRERVFRTRATFFITHRGKKQTPFLDGLFPPPPSFVLII